jgi:hypothetical protein
MLQSVPDEISLPWLMANQAAVAATLREHIAMRDCRVLLTSSGRQGFDLGDKGGAALLIPIQIPSVAAATGGATVDAQARAQLAALLTALRASGLMG